MLINETHFLRDIFKKLIYSMETSFISARNLGDILQNNHQNLQNQQNLHKSFQSNPSLEILDYK